MNNNMNNNNYNFDPMTGQPIVNNIPAVQEQNQFQQSVNQNSNTVTENPIQQIQNIPTIEQSQQQFIDNTQAQNTENNKEKKEGINYAFLIILFVIMFGAIFFLFPFLLKYI